MDWWSGTLGNIIASLIGTIAGYFAGLQLFKNQLREDEKSKRAMVVNSILQELQQHKRGVSKYEEMLRGTHPAEIREVWGFLTDAFESSISSGLFSLLPKETQTRLSAHYYRCSGINQLIPLVLYPVQGEEYQSSRYKKDIVSKVKNIIPSIEPLIDHLKSILDTLNDET